MKKYIFLHIILFMSLQILAQIELPNKSNFNFSTKKPFIIKAKRTSNGIALRFIPTKASIWKESIDFGYTIKRKIVENKSDNNYITLNDKPIKPIKLDQIKDLSTRKIQEELLWIPLDKYEKLIKNKAGFQAGLGLNKLFEYYIFASTRNPKLANASGMVFHDNTASSGKNYYYEVEIIGKNKETKYKSNIYFSSDQKPLKAPYLYGIGGENIAFLNWEHSPIKSPFVAYNLEVSTDGKSFIPAFKDPIYYSIKEKIDSADFQNDNKIFWTDSIEKNNNYYYYRISGIDFYGEYSIYSNIVKVIGLDKSPPSNPQSFHAEVKNYSGENKVLLNWKKELKEDDFIGYMVLRSESINKKFTAINNKILSVNKISFVDNNVLDGVPYYYILMVIDKSGNFSYTPKVSITIPDKTPPKPPIGIKWEISKTGIVTINWSPNEEIDIKGYRIFSSNHSNKDFLSITPMPLDTNTFQDTISLNRLNKKHFYHIIAFDKYYNHSKYSELITVTIPDTIKPSPPHRLSVINNNKNISLSWTPSISKDVVSQNIYSYNYQLKKWKLLKNIKGNSQDIYKLDFVDSLKYYGFYITVIDDTGLESANSNKDFLKNNTIKVLPKVNNLQALKLKNGHIKLTWVVPKTNSKLKYLIYRSSNNEPPSLYKSTNNLEFIDKSIESESNYNYYLCTQDFSGKKSTRSNLVKVLSK